MKTLKYKRKRNSLIQHKLQTLQSLTADQLLSVELLLLSVSNSTNRTHNQVTEIG